MTYKNKEITPGYCIEEFSIAKTLDKARRIHKHMPGRSPNHISEKKRVGDMIESASNDKIHVIHGPCETDIQEFADVYKMLTGRILFVNKKVIMKP